MNDINTTQPKEQTINAASGVNIAIGAWLVISSWVLGYNSSAIMWSNLIVGAAVMVLGIIRVASHSRASVPSWLNGLLGLWLVVAPFVMQGVTTGEKWNSFVAGIVVAVLALTSGTAGATRHT